MSKGTGSVVSPARGVQVVEAEESAGTVRPPQVERVRLCRVLSGGLVSWRKNGVGHRERVSRDAAWVCPPFEGPDELEISCAMRLGYVFLDGSIFAEALDEHGLQRLALRSEENTEDVTLNHMTDVLIRESRQQFQAGPLFMQSIQTALSAYLVTQYARADGRRSLFTGGLAPRGLRRCIDYIDSHLDCCISLEDLASEVGLSKSHLVRSFRYSTGKTPYRFVLERRVEQAKSLLQLATQPPLIEVALRCGFANQQHFSRVFKQVVRTTPSEYRRHQS